MATGDGYVGNSADTNRIFKMQQQREQEKKAFEELKRKSASQTGGLLQFGVASASETLETAFKKETIGLVTREQFVEKRQSIQQKLADEAVQRREENEATDIANRKSKKAKKVQGEKVRLSFVGDEEEEDGDAAPAMPPPKSGKYASLGKNPHVETSFLPDREREESERKLREDLREQWNKKQERVKNEPLEITYSYWDGTGHRRVITVRKGDTIGDFLRQVQQQLASEFREMRSASVENLMYIKEDLIIPQNNSFYELIINRARGKSGPLFNFDVHEDVRVVSDASVEKDESHAGKVVERHWYEKNKHIFPASRWEIYDPDKKYDRYTIHGD
eukprot:jgi/Mesvir1/12061/Mv00347-RA.1